MIKARSSGPIEPCDEVRSGRSESGQEWNAGVKSRERPFVQPRKERGTLSMSNDTSQYLHCSIAPNSSVKFWSVEAAAISSNVFSQLARCLNH